MIVPRLNELAPFARRPSSVPGPELEWNVVATVREDGYGRVSRFLQEFGTVQRTPYLNVLVLKAVDRAGLLEALRECWQDDVRLHASLARVLPAGRTFRFRSPAEFHARTSEILEAWSPAVAGKSFHVRVHRRGFRRGISGGGEERRLGDVVLQALWGNLEDARVALEDSDAVFAVETVGTRAGVELFTREDLRRYPFLDPDGRA